LQPALKTALIFNVLFIDLKHGKYHTKTALYQLYKG